MVSLQFPTETKLNGFVFINVFMPPAFIESTYCIPSNLHAAEDDREAKETLLQV